MKKRSIALLLFVTCMASAHAQESVPLCSPPSDPDCVEPKWGQIDPSGFVGGTTMGSGDSATGSARSGQIAMRVVPVATKNSSGAPAQLTATLDATAMFKRETDALTAAIGKARFDAKGNIVKGEEGITTAAEAARKAAPNYALTLYIKAPAHLPQVKRQVLISKVSSINAVLDRSAAGADPKPRS